MLSDINNARKYKAKLSVICRLLNILAWMRTTEIRKLVISLIRCITEFRFWTCETLPDKVVCNHLQKSPWVKQPRPRPRPRHGYWVPRPRSSAPRGQGQSFKNLMWCALVWCGLQLGFGSSRSPSCSDLLRLHCDGYRWWIASTEVRRQTGYVVRCILDGAVDAINSNLHHCRRLRFTIYRSLAGRIWPSK